MFPPPWPSSDAEYPKLITFVSAARRASMASGSCPAWSERLRPSYIGTTSELMYPGDVASHTTVAERLGFIWLW